MSRQRWTVQETGVTGAHRVVPDRGRDATRIARADSGMETRTAKRIRKSFDTGGAQAQIGGHVDGREAVHCGQCELIHSVST